MIKSLEEMLKDSGPTKEADYFEEKNLIQNSLDKCKQHFDSLEGAVPKCKELEANLKACQEKLKGADTESLKALIVDLEKMKENFDLVSIVVFGVQSEILDITDSLGDFWIPMNISHRADEIENLNEKISALINDFKELKKADEDFEGDKEMEKNISAMVNDI